MKDTSDEGCLGCGSLGMWDVGNVRCYGCGMFGMCNARDLGCSGCAMFGIWDVECGMLVYKMPFRRYTMNSFVNVIPCNA